MVFVIAVCLRFANVAFIFVVRKTVTLAALCHVKWTLVQRLSREIVGIRDSDDWFWGKFCIGRVRRVLVVGPRLELKILTDLSFRNLPNFVKKGRPSLPWSQLITIKLIIFFIFISITFAFDAPHDLLKFSVVQIVINVVQPAVIYFFRTLPERHPWNRCMPNMKGYILCFQVPILYILVGLGYLYCAWLKHFFGLFSKLVQTFGFSVFSLTNYRLLMHDNVVTSGMDLRGNPFLHLFSPFLIKENIFITRFVWRLWKGLLIVGLIAIVVTIFSLICLTWNTYRNIA